MEFEYWWLLALPLFFALGWFARGRERGDTGRRGDDGLPANYLKAVNLLLDDRPDAAIDAFTEVVRVHPDALDLHFALGALFRRRGETDRAIRVHRNLVERSSLGDEDRARARFALGQDYLKAGLIDRAEAAFDGLAGTSLEGAAAGQRLEIARMTHDWQRVIALTDGLPDDDGQKVATRLHAHAELAEAALAAGRLDEAGTELAAAGEAEPDHPRVLIDLARLAASRHRSDESLGLHQKLATVRPDVLPLHVSDWLAVARSVGSPETLAASLARIGTVPGALASPDVQRALALARAEVESARAAVHWLRTCLTSHPSLIGMETLLELMDKAEAEQRAGAGAGAGAGTGVGVGVGVREVAAAGGQGGGAQVVAAAAAVVDVVAEVAADHDARATLQSLVKRQAERQSRFVCRSCGFRGRRHYWQCPGCNRWDTYPAQREDEGEA